MKPAPPTTFLHPDATIILITAVCTDSHSVIMPRRGFNTPSEYQPLWSLNNSEMTVFNPVLYVITGT